MYANINDKGLGKSLLFGNFPTFQPFVSDCRCKMRKLAPRLKPPSCLWLITSEMQGCTQLRARSLPLDPTDRTWNCFFIHSFPFKSWESVLQDKKLWPRNCIFGLSWIRLAQYSIFANWVSQSGTDQMHPYQRSRPSEETTFICHTTSVAVVFQCWIKRKCLWLSRIWKRKESQSATLRILGLQTGITRLFLRWYCNLPKLCHQWGNAFYSSWIRIDPITYLLDDVRITMMMFDVIIGF